MGARCRARRETIRAARFSRSTGVAGFIVVVAAREMEVSRYLIFAAITQWLAAQQPPAGQQAAAPGAETFDRNPCIIGAGGVEAAARAEYGAELTLVHMLQPQYLSVQDVHVAVSMR